MRLRFSRPVLTAIAVLILGVVACVGCRTVPPSDSAPAVDGLADDRAELKKLEAGRAIYTGRCTYCHKIRPINDYETPDWAGRILPLMTKKARLTRNEAEALGLYVLTVRAACDAAEHPSLSPSP